MIRSWYRTAKNIALSATLICLATLPAHAADPVKIGVNIWIGTAPFYVADALDLYKKYNTSVKLRFFNDLALVPPAMASGGLDGGVLTYDMVVANVARNMKQRVVMPVDYSNGGDAILASKEITKITDFKGKKVAFNPLSPSDFLLSYALKSNGMSEKDIKPVNMGAEAVAAAMASGGVPIGVTYQPSISEIEKIDGGKKFHVVYSSKEAPGLITDVLVFNQKFIDAHPAEVKAVIQGYLDALAYMKSNPDEAVKHIAKAMKLKPEEVKEQFPDVFNLPLADMPKVFAKSKDTMSFHTTTQVIGELLKSKKQIKAIPAVENTYDDQFVKALIAGK